MSRQRPPYLITSGTTTIGLVGLFAVSGRGQGLQTLLGVAPPPIQRGISPDASHQPGTRETRRRLSIRSVSAVPERAGTFGARYRTDRVIVKFRDGMTPA